MPQTPALGSIYAAWRLLIVDDNDTNRLLLRQMTHRWDMQPEVANSGPVALQRIRHAIQEGYRFNVILLDEQMPGMDGFEVLERLRADPGNRDGITIDGAAIMMLTSVDHAANAAKCRQHAVPVYLIKPTRIGELLAALQTALRFHRKRRYRQACRQHSNLPRSFTEKFAPYPGSRRHLVNQKIAAALLGRMGPSRDLGR